MPDFNDLITASKKMSERMKEMQEALKKIQVEGVAGTGTVSVKVIMNGEGELQKVTLGDSILKESKEIIEDLILSAVSKAVTQLRQKKNDEISKITGGIDLPPGFKLPF